MRNSLWIQFTLTYIPKDQQNVCLRFSRVTSDHYHYCNTDFKCGSLNFLFHIVYKCLHILSSYLVFSIIIHYCSGLVTLVFWCDWFFSISGFVETFLLHDEMTELLATVSVDVEDDISDSSRRHHLAATTDKHCFVRRLKNKPSVLFVLSTLQVSQYQTPSWTDQVLTVQ